MLRYYLSFSLLIFVLFACADEIVTETPTVFDGTNNEVVLARYSSIRDNVLQPTCGVSGCHSNSFFPQLSGDSYNNIINVTSTAGISYVKPGSPSESYLLKKIKGQDIYGARMPYGQPPLNQDVIDSVEAWITNGAQNN